MLFICRCRRDDDCVRDGERRRISGCRRWWYLMTLRCMTLPILPIFIYTPPNAMHVDSWALMRVTSFNVGLSIALFAAGHRDAILAAAWRLILRRRRWILGTDWLMFQQREPFGQIPGLNECYLITRPTVHTKKIDWCYCRCLILIIDHIFYKIDITGTSLVLITF